MIQKFRVWNKKTESFIDYGDLMLDLKNGKVYAGDVGIPEYTIDVTKQVILMQSTGLKDKNGVEIYEGDIVHWLKEFISPMDMRTKLKIDSNKEVHQKESGEWGMGEINNALSNELFNVEVIGNIYENPELLEVAE